MGMIEIRIHGRGGQGAVLASKILAVAVFREGRQVQAFPVFGVERRGAPVTAFTRIDDKPIRLRTDIYEPDHIVVLDDVLARTPIVREGLKPGGWVLINSARPPGDFDGFKENRVGTVDGNSISRSLGLGSASAPIVNTGIVGALSRVLGVVKLDSVLESIREEIPHKPEENVEAAKQAYEKVVF
jgi:2-oxoacid:acceptor oxidoreductase gamma subunit (pyruvate/2-ketoisovalerate family)